MKRVAATFLVKTLRQVIALVTGWAMLMMASQAQASPLVLAPEPVLVQEAPEAKLSPAQIDELVSPTALYPDALVAQVLAGSTFPDQVVQANTWLQANSQLNEAQRTEQVNHQSWDVSVKALTQFPSVLDNMAKNLSWTSALGDAFYNQQKDVMASVQKLRKQAQAAGNLKSTSQQTVKTETQQGEQVIVIQPASPQVVYVPTYNPTVVYGTPYYPPGYSTAGLVAVGVISFGIGIAIGAAMSNGCCGWGWGYWGCGWHSNTVVFNRNVYVSNSPIYRNGGYYGNRPRPTPYGNVNRPGNRNTNISGNTINVNTGDTINVNRGPDRGNGPSGVPKRGGNPQTLPVNERNSPPQQLPAAERRNAPRQSPAVDRGYGQRPPGGAQTGPFGGYTSGGNARVDRNRGQASLGGAKGTNASTPKTRSRPSRKQS